MAGSPVVINRTSVVILLLLYYNNISAYNVESSTKFRTIFYRLFLTTSQPLVGEIIKLMIYNVSYEKTCARRGETIHSPTTRIAVHAESNQVEFLNNISVVSKYRKVIRFRKSKATTMNVFILAADPTAVATVFSFIKFILLPLHIVNYLKLCQALTHTVI